MIKVLIVDDEKVIRDGLSKIITSFSPHYEVVGMAANGKSALTEAQRLKPDICLVDMKMPLMEGDEFIRLARQEFPYMDFVVLSGYAEFNYARKLIGMGCSAYLLKPVNHEELCKLLLSLKSKIERRQFYSAENSGLLQETLVSEQYEKERRLYHFLVDRGHQSFKTEEFATLGFGPGKHYYICVFSIDRAYISLGNGYKALPITEKWQEFRLHVREILKKSHRLIGACFDLNKRAIVVLLSHLLPGLTRLEGAVLDFINKLHDSFLTNKIDFSYTVGFCGPVSEPSEMPLTLIRAREAVSLRFFHGYDRVYCYKEVPPINQSIDSFLFNSYKKTITEALMHGDHDGFSSIFSRLLADLKNTPSNRAMLLSFLCNLYINILDKLFLIYEPRKIRKLLPEYALFEETLHHLDSYDSLQDYFSHIIKNIVDVIKDESSNAYCSSILSALRYISNNYEQNIGLGDISRCIGMNPSYLCYLFKQQTGRTFVNYLTSYRIDRAKELLTEGYYSVMEISSMVGYKDVKYFSKLFKRHTNQNPSKYRKKALETAQN